MADINNLFKAAMSCADDAILGVMSDEAKITSGALAGNTVAGVFDDPESIAYAGGGVRIEGSSPSLFVKSVSVRGLRRPDTLTVNGLAFWVDRVGTDDAGCCYVWLVTGTPPTSNRHR